MFRSLFGHPQEEYTILVFGNYYGNENRILNNGSVVSILFSLPCIICTCNGNRIQNSGFVVSVIISKNQNCVFRLKMAK
jgi:hypothetical protein